MTTRYLHTRDAAGYVNLGKSTLERYRVTGEGPRFRRLSPKRVVYAIEDLDAWAASRAFNSTSEYPARAA